MLDALPKPSRTETNERQAGEPKRNDFGRVASRSNTWTDIQERVSDYLGAGTRLVWVVDPPTRTVTVYRPGVQALRLGASAELEGDDVLPGFRARLDAYFNA